MRMGFPLFLAGNTFSHGDTEARRRASDTVKHPEVPVLNFSVTSVTSVAKLFVFRSPMNYRSLFLATIQTTALFMAGLAIPLLGQLAAIFAPVPLVILALREGRQAGGIALLAAALLTGLLFGWQSGGIFFFSFGLMAIGIFEGLQRRWKPESASLVAGLLPVVAVTVVTVYYFVRIGKNPVTVIETYLKGSMSEAAKLYAQLGLAEMASVINSVSDAFVHNLVRLIPGITIATSVLQAACCYGLSRAVIMRRPGPATPVLNRTTLAQWHAPDVWVWGLIVGLTLIMVPDETARFAGWNLAIIYSVVYLIQGVAVVDHYLRKARIQPFMRGMIHSLIVALPSIVFVIALGVVDIWADFRKLRGPAQPNAGDS